MAEVENNENVAFAILMYAFIWPLVASLKKFQNYYQIQGS